MRYYSKKRPSLHIRDPTELLLLNTGGGREVERIYVRYLSSNIYGSHSKMAPQKILLEKTAETFIGKLLSLNNIHLEGATNVKADV